MKILLAGDYRYEWYQEAAASALERQGHEVVRFAWFDFFQYPSLKGRIQIRLMLGPAFGQVNDEFARCVKFVRPDLVFTWTCWPIWPDVIRQLRTDSSAIWVSYINDDPFSPTASASHWRFFKTSIRLFDIHFVFRHANIPEFYAAGARVVKLLRAYYVSDIHRPCELSKHDLQRFQSDATFVGHYEDDGRVDYLRTLLAAGLHVRIFGAGWSSKALRGLPLSASGIVPVYGDEYAKAIVGARCALCFLSRHNRDTYTRRSFEIPACGGLLLSEYTDDLATLYEPDAEAVFFSSPVELVDKARWLVNNPEQARRIASAGRARCIRDGHDVDSRMRQMLDAVVEHTGNR